MMRKHSLFVLSLAVLSGALVPAGQAQAAPPPARHFVAICTGAQEVPPVITRARGVAVFHLNPAGNQLRFVLVVSRIRNVVASHIHPGMVGMNGPPLVPLFGPVPPGGGPVNGVLSRGAFVRGGNLTVAQFDALIASLRSGNTYVNIHTSPGVPSGEIRGQIIPRP